MNVKFQNMTIHATDVYVKVKSNEVFIELQSNEPIGTEKESWANLTYPEFIWRPILPGHHGSLEIISEEQSWFMNAACIEIRLNRAVFKADQKYFN